MKCIHFEKQDVSVGNDAFDHPTYRCYCHKKEKSILEYSCKNCKEKEMMDMFEWKSEAHARGVSHWIKINKNVEIALDNFNHLRKDFYRFSLIINSDHAIHQCNLTADSWEDAETLAIKETRKFLLSEKKFWTQAYGDFENLRLEE